MAGIILNRLAVMFVYLIPGFILYKKKIITDAGAKDIGKLLIYMILPAAIINSYNIEYSKEKVIGLLISFTVALVAVIISVVLSRLLFKKDKPIEIFGASFSNAGFMGIPLVAAVVGADAVYYCAAFVAILNILQWSYGVFLMTGNKTNISLKKIIFNPILLSFVIGICLFFFPVKLPEFFGGILSTVASMNAPVAMLGVGIYFAQVSFKELFYEKISYKVSLIRLLVIPLITAIVIALLPMGDYTLKQTLVIVASAPIGSNVAVYAQIYGCDYKQAVKEVVLSTLLCIASMPLIIGISDYILQNIR